jgi:arginase
MSSGVRRPIAIIGAPSSAGAYAPGQELAPAALRDVGLAGALWGDGREVRDRGDLPAFRWCVDCDSPRARHQGAVVAMIEGVRDESVAALAEGCAVLVLGGDCTTGLGSIAALLSTGEDPGVVYLDLHADLNVPSSVTDGALDWMGLGHALNLPGAAARGRQDLRAHTRTGRPVWLWRGACHRVRARARRPAGVEHGER